MIQPETFFIVVLGINTIVLFCLVLDYVFEKRHNRKLKEHYLKHLDDSSWKAVNEYLQKGTFPWLSDRESHDEIDKRLYDLRDSHGEDFVLILEHLGVKKVDIRKHSVLEKEDKKK